MALTNADHQRAYRQRKAAEGAGRLTAMVSAETRAQLARLARHAGESQQDVLERLIAKAEADVLRRVKDKAGYFED